MALNPPSIDSQSQLSGFLPRARISRLAITAVVAAIRNTAYGLAAVVLTESDCSAVPDSAVVPPVAELYVPVELTSQVKVAEPLVRVTSAVTRSGKFVGTGMSKWLVDIVNWLASIPKEAPVIIQMLPFAPIVGSKIAEGPCDILAKLPLGWLGGLLCLGELY